MQINDNKPVCIIPQLELCYYTYDTFTTKLIISWGELGTVVRRLGVFSWHSIWNSPAMQTDTFWTTYVDLGASAQKLGHTLIADKMLGAALEESRRLGHLNLPPPTVFNKLAAAFYAQSDFKKAEAVYKSALSTYEKRLTDDHPHLSNILLNLAELYFSLEKYTMAEPLFERSLLIDERRYGSFQPHMYRRMLKLAWIYCNQDKHADAYSLLKKARDFKDKSEKDLQQEIFA